MLRFITLTICIISANLCVSSNVIQTKTNFDLIGDKIFYLVDSNGLYTRNNIQYQNFKLNPERVLNLDMQESTVWLKFTVNNILEDSTFLIDIENSNFDLVTFYELEGEDLVYKGKIGDMINYNESDRFFNDPFPVFQFSLANSKTKTFYLKVQNKEPIIIPMYLGTEQSIVGKIQKRELFFGIYAGVMVVMFLYNLFIFFSLRTKMYFLYVVYISLIFLAQSNFLGYANKYFFFNHSTLSNIGSYIFPAFVIIQGLYFISEFLSIQQYTPKIRFVFIGFAGLCLISIIMALIGKLQQSFYLLQPVAGVSAIFILILCVIHIRKGSRQAKFLIFAWSFFFIGVIVWVLKNLGVLEHTFLTNYSMPIGSALETVLLSFALADRINTLKKEREDSQKQMLEEMQKNKTLTENLNKELETQVAERTQTLEITNNDLSVTLANLKETQSQLVEAEKMASLGQLTAGIAHEINNPINFVSSNVEPLRNDIQDILTVLSKYRQYAEQSDDQLIRQILEEEDELDLPYSIKEIEQLVNGIEEGARRTSEIVNGLKNFSRSDEEAFKKSDINSGLNSTVTILKSQLRNVSVNLDFGDLPKVDCQLGKLNQVFMNIIDNSIDAINDKWGDKPGGELKISSKYENEFVVIEINDNGKGMPDDVKKHIFDPFFTTKDVGQGTGLGLSISYGIIEKHNGKIEVNSVKNEGTTFVIQIPNKKSKTANAEE